MKTTGSAGAQGGARAGAPLRYVDLIEDELERLQAANLRYLMFLGLRGPLDAQGHADRAVYGRLLTLAPSGEGRVDDDNEVIFLMAVTGLPRAVCTAYLDAD